MDSFYGRVKPKCGKLEFGASPLCTHHLEVRQKTDWHGIKTVSLRRAKYVTAVSVNKLHQYAAQRVSR